MINPDQTQTEVGLNSGANSDYMMSPVVDNRRAKTLQKLKYFT